jgi:hypothetical protein
MLHGVNASLDSATEGIDGVAHKKSVSRLWGLSNVDGAVSSSTISASGSGPVLARESLSSSIAASFMALSRDETVYTLGGCADPLRRSVDRMGV